MSVKRMDKWYNIRTNYNIISLARSRGSEAINIEQRLQTLWSLQPFLLHNY